ncbi:hypothetical protein ACSBR1_014619 [Camellia fascicularis]
MWCYCRETYMPMAYLYRRKYHGPITDLIKSLRREIHTKPYEEIDWNKAHHDCYKEDLYYHHTFIQDLLWDSLHYLNWLCEMSLISFLLQSLKMMCWWAENPDGDEFKHHLARVPDYLWLAEDGMKMQCLLILSQMPLEIAREKANIERLYDAVNVLLYVHVQHTFHI